MIAAGWNVVLTHGNGPQVGFILRRSEIADGQVPTVPMHYAVGDTQGAIGFMFQNALGNALRRRGIDKPVVTLVTQTLVDRNDPAFAHPDKPIGSFMTEDVARQLAARARLDGHAGRQSRLAAYDRVAAALANHRGEQDANGAKARQRTYCWVGSRDRGSDRRRSFVCGAKGRSLPAD